MRAGGSGMRRTGVAAMTLMAPTMGAGAGRGKALGKGAGARGDLEALASRVWDFEQVETAGSPFDTAPWPEFNADAKLGAVNVQGKALPAGLDRVQWLTGEDPAATAEARPRVLIIVFWATWAGPSVRAVDTVEGVAARHGKKVRALALAGQDERASAVRSYIHAQPDGFERPGLSVGIDERQVLYRALDVQAIPHALVVSTDGVVRWQGNPLDPRFNEAVYRVVDADPGAAYRRAQAAATP